jgi:hypothetical protein
MNRQKVVHYFRPCLSQDRRYFHPNDLVTFQLPSFPNLPLLLEQFRNAQGSEAMISEFQALPWIQFLSGSMCLKRGKGIII